MRRPNHCDTEGDVSGTSSPNLPIRRALLFAAVLGGLVLGIWWSDLGVRDLLGWLERLEQAGPVPFAFGVLAWALLMLPASVQMGSAGFLYGPVVGAVVGWALSVTAAAIAFLLGRTLLRDAVVARAMHSPRWRALESEVGRRGVYVVALTRMSPLFPYNIISYALGASPVSFREYVLGTAIGVIPVVVFNAIIGAGVASLTQLLDGAPPPGGVMIGGAVLTLVATVAVTRVASRALVLPQS
ncbi:MAG: TVP38/TMEM64 family protein [Deltaproteobacteria bacterium]|nr:MAG: TVP38/TMEM64 family protein [Deltaproteobacteria bacterium]